MRNRNAFFKALLVVMILAGSHSVWALDFPIGKLTYDYQPTETPCTLKKCDLSAEGSLLIPETVKISFVDRTVTSIGDNAFSGCTALTDVTLPEGVTTIGANAFAGCTFPIFFKGTTPPTVTDETFTDYAGTQIFVPAGSREAYKSAFPGVADKIIVEALAEDVPELTFTYNIEKKTCSLTKCAQSATGSMEIPDRVVSDGEAYTVTGIGNEAFYNCASLTTITLPKSVTTIGQKAFYSCSALTTVNIPQGVTAIEDYTFYRCPALSSVTLPESVTTIGDHAFDYCPALTSLTLPEGVTSIGIYAFYNCFGLTTVNIPQGVTTIGNYTFFGCSDLTAITLPQGVTTIGAGAFYGCSTLTTLQIPEGVTSIGNIAFSGCTAPLIFNGITPPAGTDDAFTDYAGTHILVPVGCGEAYKSAYPGVADKIVEGALAEDVPELTFTYNTEEKTCSVTKCSRYASGSMKIPGNVFYNGEIYRVTSIGERAFQWCDALTSVHIHKGLTTIESYAFANCTALTTVILSESVATIGDYAFRRCSALTDVILPEGVTTIENGAFFDCTALSSITLPESVTTIGSAVFQGCTSLNAVNIPANVTTIESNTFRNCWSLTAIDIPKGVTSIKMYAFYSCDLLKSVNIPLGVTSIEPEAFSYSSALIDIVLPEGVTNLAAKAFEGNSALKNIFVPYDWVETYKTMLIDGADKVVGSVDIALKQASIGGAYASLYLPFAVSIEPGEAKAYVGKTLDSDILHMSQATEVAAKNGFILHADQATTATLKIIGTTETAATSLLAGTTKDITLDDTNRDDHLLFGVKKVSEGETATLGFFKPAASVVSIAAGKAFLPNTGDAMNIRMQFDFNPTGVEEVNTAEKPNTTVYDLRGLPVQRLIKGHLYIRGGKTFIAR